MVFGALFYIYIFFSFLYALLGVLVFSRRENVIPNRILGINLIALPVFFMYYANLMEGLYSEYTHFFDFTWIAYYLFGPLLFLYIRSMLGGGFYFKREFPHFILPVAAAIFSFSMYSWGSAGVREAYVVGMIDVEYEGNSFVFRILKGVFVLQYTTYLVKSIMIIYRHQSALRSLGTEQSLSVIKWLKRLIYFKSPIFILTLVFYSVIHNRFIVDIVPVANYAINFALLIQLIRQPYAFSGIEPERIASEFNQMRKWKKKQLFSEKALHQLFVDAKARITKQQLFSDHSLTVKTLADEMNQPILLLLYALDKNAKVPFDKFVMQCRIEAAEKMLTDSQYHDNSIDFIAFELGFESTEQFQDIFMKYKKMSPQAFRNWFV